MKIWILVVWLSSGPFASTSYDTKAECMQKAAFYTKAVCLPLDVPTSPK